MAQQLAFDRRELLQHALVLAEEGSICLEYDIVITRYFIGFLKK